MRYIGFAVCGFVNGGGCLDEGTPRETFEEAWADAQALVANLPYEKTAGVRPVSGD